MPFVATGYAADGRFSLCVCVCTVEKLLNVGMS